jgi:hypothetical protein
MTATQLTKMREGRERQLAAKRVEQTAAVLKYREFVRLESQLYTSFKELETIHGAKSSEAAAARRDWAKCWADAPEAPPDHAAW